MSSPPGVVAKKSAGSVSTVVGSAAGGVVSCSCAAVAGVQGVGANTWVLISGCSGGGGLEGGMPAGVAAVDDTVSEEIVGRTLDVREVGFSSAVEGVVRAITVGWRLK